MLELIKKHRLHVLYAHDSNKWHVSALADQKVFHTLCLAIEDSLEDAIELCVVKILSAQDKM